MCDSDGDGLSNGLEAFHGTDPLDQDTDGDTFNDGAEVTAGDDPLDPCDPDATDGLCDMDGDGVSNQGEVILFGTDPTDPDTDGDGLNDGLELFVLFTDPLDPTDP